MEKENSSIRSKRPLSQVDEADECMPISKRINNLNIRGARTSQEEPLASHEAAEIAATMERTFGTVMSPDCLYNIEPPSLSEPICIGYRHSLFPGAINLINQLNSCVSGFRFQPMTSPLDFLAANTQVHPHPPPQALPSFNRPPAPLMENPSAFFDEYDEQMQEVEGEEETVYDPELGETENPHYYHINRLLFNAHCDRRTRQEGDPLVSGPPSIYLP